MSSAREVRLILGDQLHIGHSWFAAPPDDGVVYLLAEVRSETDYALHHVRKVVAFFLAMRAFAEELRARGHRVEYIRIGDPEAAGTLHEQCERTCTRLGASAVRYQLPDEWRLDEAMRSWAREAAERGIAVYADDTEHFLTDREAFAQHFAGKKTFIMEGFYRALRRKYGVLLDAAGAPEGGEWNFDAENRKPLPKGHVPPEPRAFPRDVQGLVDELAAAGVRTCGRCGTFDVPVTRAEGLALLADFIERALPRFGPFQDALSDGGVMLYHSGLSFVMNAKLLTPREVISAVEAAWRADPDRIPLSSAEGFIRQILGWREYVRGHYWAHMPGYAELNYFGHDRALPEWFWTGRTRMACVRQALDSTLNNAYAHHIQRLMVTGNFMLLAGIHPDAVDAWYLGVYIDAVEWVEMPNARGMSQFADGGLVGTKPYASGANYLRKMGAPCGTCAYRADERTGPAACPFTALYWHFHVRNRALLERNPRIGMVYRTWDKMAAADRQALWETAEANLQRIELL
jgi:deoxyribodipyrimidine photolyase-related protein